MNHLFSYQKSICRIILVALFFSITIPIQGMLTKKIKSFVNKRCYIKGFLPDTLIKTEQGLKKISDLTKQDKVISVALNNRFKQNLAKRKISQLHKFSTDKLIKIYLIDQTIPIATGSEQEFYVWKKGWIKAKNLTPLDNFLHNESKKIDISHIEIEQLNKPILLFDITVDKDHNFCILPHNVYAHNVTEYITPEAIEAALELTRKAAESGAYVPGWGYVAKGVVVVSSVAAYFFCKKKKTSITGFPKYVPTDISTKKNLDEFINYWAPTPLIDPNPNYKMPEGMTPAEWDCYGNVYIPQGITWKEYKPIYDRRLQVLGIEKIKPYGFDAAELAKIQPKENPTVGITKNVTPTTQQVVQVATEVGEINPFSSLGNGNVAKHAVVIKGVPLSAEGAARIKSFQQKILPANQPRAVSETAKVVVTTTQEVVNQGRTWTEFFWQMGEKTATVATDVAKNAAGNYALDEVTRYFDNSRELSGWREQAKEENWDKELKECGEKAHKNHIPLTWEWFGGWGTFCY